MSARLHNSAITAPLAHVYHAQQRHSTASKHAFGDSLWFAVRAARCRDCMLQICSRFLCRRCACTTQHCDEGATSLLKGKLYIFLSIQQHNNDVLVNAV